jgi:hypothetical protein
MLKFNVGLMSERVSMVTVAADIFGDKLSEFIGEISPKPLKR